MESTPNPGSSLSNKDAGPPVVTIHPLDDNPSYIIGVKQPEFGLDVFLGVPLAAPRKFLAVAVSFLNWPLHIDH